MKDDPTHKHHEGLPYNQVRDLLAAQTRDHEVSLGMHVREEYRVHLVNEIEKAKRALASYDKGAALRSIMVQFGWTEHDVSDHVDYDKDTYQSFIGTEEERKERYPDETNKTRRR